MGHLLNFDFQQKGMLDVHPMRKKEPMNMPKIIEANLVGKGKKFAIVVSRFNDFITDKLVGGAVDALIRCGAKDADIEIVKVPGAFEIPLVAKKWRSMKKYDAIICLGAVIRGATPHFDYVSAEVSKGIAVGQPGSFDSGDLRDSHHRHH